MLPYQIQRFDARSSRLEELPPDLNQLVYALSDQCAPSLQLGVITSAKVLQIVSEIENDTHFVHRALRDRQESLEFLRRSLPPVTFGKVDRDRSGCSAQLRRKFYPLTSGELDR